MTTTMDTFLDRETDSVTSDDISLLNYLAPLGHAIAGDMNRNQGGGGGGDLFAGLVDASLVSDFLNFEDWFSLDRPSKASV